jgi:TatD DNase family protein
MLIDTHCHLYSEELLLDMEHIMQNASANNIGKIVMPNIDSGSIETMLELEKKYAGICYATMGLHPCYVAENIDEQLKTVEKWFETRKFVAVGECGIDMYWDKTTLPLQQKALEFQFYLSEKYNLPLLLHTRSANQITIDMIKQYNGASNKLKGIFHCFSGTIEEAEDVINLGFYLGIGGVVTFKNGGLDKIIEKVGLEHLVLETDSPYLAPVPYRGKRNEPSYTHLVAQKIAEIKQTTLEEIALITTKNAQKIFNF